MSGVCIGVHVHAEPEQLLATLAALRTHTPEGVRLFLLPDGPDEPTRRLLATLADLPQLGTDAPRGPPACFNRLAAATDDPLLVLLESGALVTPGWLDRLRRALARNPTHGLAGPSTNLSWNEQGAFPGRHGTREAILATAAEAAQRFGEQVRTLTPLHSLADFCYAVRREVITAIGGADEAYGLGPCWEMDYNIRAARHGFVGVWACAAYVHRTPLTERRRQNESQHFEASRHRYQDKFCGLQLRGERLTYAAHCRGDACAEFAPLPLLRSHEPLPIATPSRATAATVSSEAPLVSCIMPTCDRRLFVPQAIRYFLRQDLSNIELIIIDDGTDVVADCVPTDPRLRYYRLQGRQTIGAKRNLACQLARGKFIAHWDDDDWYPPQRLSRQLDGLRHSGASLCGSSQELFWEPTTDRAFHYHYQNPEPVLVGTSLFYRKSLWQRFPFPDIQIGEDVRFVRAQSTAMHDLSDPTLCIGIIHRCNTSPKNTQGLFFRPYPNSEIHQLLGDDLRFYQAKSAGPLVSCIMPTRDRRAFIPLAIEHFLAQDYLNRELIIVDDGATAIGDLVTQLPSIKYIRVPSHLSIGEKRNLACREARGEIIAHWDDDDWYSPGRLSWQLAPLLADTADITGLELRFVLVLPEGVFWTTDAQLHQRMFVGDVAGGTLVYRRSIFTGGVRYPDVSLAEDAAFLRNAQRQGRRLARLKNPGVFIYVRHSRNTWRFEAGRFLDPAGWTKIVPPAEFTEQTLARYRACAA